jgi:hypothetical protein
MSDFRAERIIRHKKTGSRSRRAAVTESQKPKAQTEKAPYIFSVLSSYFTVPFLSFWRVTSSLV